MDKRDDLVIGAITGYDWQSISPWVNSLMRCGYTGKKAMLCYNVGFDVVDKLIERDFTVFTFGKDEANKRYFYKPSFSIVVERFFHMWYFLHKLRGHYRYLLTTDVKDVVFQKDPSVWLEDNINDTLFRTDVPYNPKQIVVGSESIRYKDENWGRQNFLDSFGPVVYESVKDNTIVNAGTFSGHFNYMIDLFQAITHFSIAGSQKIHNPDQAALNLLVSLEPWKSITHVAPSESGYAAQLGTTMDPTKIGEYGPKLTEPKPSYSADGTVCTSEFLPYTIVHQYDRIPELRELILKKYKD